MLSVPALCCPNGADVPNLKEYCGNDIIYPTDTRPRRKIPLEEETLTDVPFVQVCPVCSLCFCLCECVSMSVCNHIYENIHVFVCVFMLIECLARRCVVTILLAYPRRSGTLRKSWDGRPVTLTIAVKSGCTRTTMSLALLQMVCLLCVCICMCVCGCMNVCVCVL